MLFRGDTLTLAISALRTLEEDRQADGDEDQAAEDFGPVAEMAAEDFAAEEAGDDGEGRHAEDGHP